MRANWLRVHQVAQQEFTGLSGRPMAGSFIKSSPGTEPRSGVWRQTAVIRNKLRRLAISTKVSACRRTERNCYSSQPEEAHSRSGDRIPMVGGQTDSQAAARTLSLTS